MTTLVTGTEVKAATPARASQQAEIAQVNAAGSIIRRELLTRLKIVLALFAGVGAGVGGWFLVDAYRGTGTVPINTGVLLATAMITALLAALIQMAAILLLLAVCSPVLGMAVYGVVQAAPLWEWVALVAGIVWCSLLLWGGVVFGGRMLDRRGPQVLATIRTWPGHAQPV